jgi:phosphotriesterase-related protein
MNVYNSATMSKLFAQRVTRRRALEVLGIRAVTAGAPRGLFAQGPVFPKGAIIRTILKDYAPEELAGGATLFHEHMQLAPDFNARFAAATAAARAANGLPPLSGRGGAGRGGPDIMHDVDLMSAEVAKTRSDGVACIVDGGHADMGRSIDFLRQVSMKSGVPIVAGGGFYSQPFYPKEISTMSEEQIVKALIKQTDDDILGVFGEIGSWDEITADERKVFRAVGRAHVATNLPIFTHTGIPGKSALEQLDILEDAGVKPDRVVIGHLGNLVDANVYVQKAICRRGAFVGFDRQGGNNDAQQVPMVMALLEAGFADHLMFSADASSGYAKTLTVFLPKLKAAGVSEQVLHRIMVDNPRRFLAFVPKRRRKG